MPSRPRAIGVGLVLLLGSSLSRADDVELAKAVVGVSPSAVSSDADAAPASDTSLHVQLTNVTQRHPRFNAPYSGTNSLTATNDTQETTDITVYAGVRLWRGAEAWLNPEIDQGFGFDKTVGAAGFTSGEAYKVGANAPYLRLPRLYLRQVVPLGGTAVDLDASAGQFGGTTTANNLTMTIGKFSVVDVFDTNRYAHDPRSDFMNWSLVDVGTFDYAADAWGFTYGLSAELALGAWTTRLGYFQLSSVPNGKITAVDFSEHECVAEVEYREDWFGPTGKVRASGFVNRGRMGNYLDAVALARGTGAPPDIAAVRKPGSRVGGSIDVEQPVADGIGLFGRVGVNNGAKEAYEFTEINRTASAGLSIEGKRWNRPSDVIGIAGVANQLSHSARRYFEAGGLGILIGDGRLNDGTEKIFEAYYSVGLLASNKVTFDYQHLTNPAYNRDRGPVSVYSFRLHLEH